MSREFKEKTLSIEKIEVEKLKVLGDFDAAGGVAGISDLVGDPDVNITATANITIGTTGGNILINDGSNLVVTVDDVSITSASEIDLVGGAGNPAGAVTVTAGAGAGTSITGGPVIITAGAGSAPNGTGGAVTVTGGAGAGAGTGGAVSLTAGNGSGSGAIGGVVMLQAGSSGSGGEGGEVSLLAGNGAGTNSVGGVVNIEGGAATDSASGGTVTITGGNSVTGVGGDVTLAPGTGSPNGVLNLASVVVIGNDITFVDEITYADALADATAAGRLRRNGAALTFHDGTAVRRLANLEAIQTFSGDKTFSARIIIPVIATASLPAAGAGENGRILIEDAGAGDRNLIIYAGGQRFRIDGGAAF